MKEATGELNMTVVTVVAIAAIGAFFYAFVWPAIKKSIENTTRCSNAICDCGISAKSCVCTYIDGSTSTSVLCSQDND